MLMPCSFNSRSTVKSKSVSLSVKLEVGSSRINRRDCSARAPRDLDELLLADRQLPDQRPRRSGQAEPLVIFAASA